MNHIPNGVSRRGVLGVAAGTALTAMLAACSNDSSSSKSSSASGSSAAFATNSVKSQFGGIKLDKKPEKIVVLYYALADWCVALGVQPAAVARWPEEVPPFYEGIFKGVLDGEMYHGSGSLSLEKLAAYKPDLIIAGDWQMDQAVYSKASKIAPTYVAPNDVWTQWHPQVAALSLLLTGSAAEGKSVEDQVRGLMAGPKEKIKGLQGKTFGFVGVDDSSINFANGAFFEELGLSESANQKGNKALSFENLGQLTEDILVIAADAAGRKKLEGDPRFKSLPAYKSNSILWPTEDQGTAINMASISGFKYLLPWAVPMLEKSKLNAKS